MRALTESGWRDLVRSLLEPELAGIYFYTEALPFGGFEFRLVRGEGRDVKVARVVLDERRIEAAYARSAMSSLLDDLRHEIRIAMWMWDRPGGLVVGQAGKWRKFNRRAA